VRECLSQGVLGCGDIRRKNGLHALSLIEGDIYGSDKPAEELAIPVPKRGFHSISWTSRTLFLYMPCGRLEKGRPNHFHLSCHIQLQISLSAGNIDHMTINLVHNFLYKKKGELDILVWIALN
jgi:hypothetical protein